MVKLRALASRAGGRRGVGCCGGDAGDGPSCAPAPPAAMVCPTSNSRQYPRPGGRGTHSVHRRAKMQTVVNSARVAGDEARKESFVICERASRRAFCFWAPARSRSPGSLRWGAGVGAGGQLVDRTRGRGRAAGPGRESASGSHLPRPRVGEPPLDCRLDSHSVTG